MRYSLRRAMFLDSVDGYTHNPTVADQTDAATADFGCLSEGVSGTPAALTGTDQRATKRARDA